MEKNNPKIISCLEVIGIIIFILTSISLALFIPQFNNEISDYEQNITETKGKLDRIYRIELFQLITHSDLTDITITLPILYQNFDVSNANQTLFAFEMVQNMTLEKYKILVYSSTIYQENRTSFEYLDEFDLEQLRQMNDELSEINVHIKKDLEFSLIENINIKMKIEDKRDFWLKIILTFQMFSFIITNSGVIYSHIKIIQKK